MTKDLIDEMLKRPARQSMDGLNEIQFGIVFLLWGGVSITLELWGAGLPEWARWSWLALFLVAVFFSATITRRLRARWVHPRIGYVKWVPPIVGRPVIAMILGGVVSFLTIVALTQSSSQFRSLLPVFIGLLMAAGTFAWWIRLRVRRLLIYALLTLASGLVAGWTLPGWLGAITVMCSVSVFYLVGGLLALRHLMRQPLATEDRP
jgi:MFS family permease